MDFKKIFPIFNSRKKNKCPSREFTLPENDGNLKRDEKALEDNYNCLINMQRRLLLNFIIEEQSQKKNDISFQILPTNSKSSLNLTQLNVERDIEIKRKASQQENRMNDKEFKRNSETSITSNNTEKNEEDEIHLIPKRSNQYSCFPNITSYLDNSDFVKNLLEKSHNINF